MTSSGSLARLQQAIKRPASQELTANDVRTLIALVNIVSLLAENCNFDTLRKEHSSTCTDSITGRWTLILCIDLAPDLNNVSQVSLLCLLVYDLLVAYASKLGFNN